MKRGLLDEEFANNGENSLSPNWKNWFSAFILWIGLLYNLLGGINIKGGIALGLLLVVTSLMVFKFSIGVKWMLLPIGLGTIGLINYLPIRMKMGYDNIGFDFMMFLLGVLHLFTNKAYFPNIFHKDVDKIKEQKEGFSANQLKQIENFKLLYAEKSLAELEKIASSEKFVMEAREAARVLLVGKSE